MPKLVIDFEGWVEVEANKVKFHYISTDQSKPQVIDGEQYLQLSEADQEDYIVASFHQALVEADDVTYGLLEVVAP